MLYLYLFSKSTKFLLGIWGVHDRQLNLRNTLHDVLRFGSRRHALYRRWRWQESKSNIQSELVFSEEEWKKEWNDVLEMAAATPRTSNSENGSTCNSQDQIYESLECIHVFTLAHILKRPIIVVADTLLRNANGEELSPILFGGIYLPLECHPDECHRLCIENLISIFNFFRSPLVLCYDSSHFSALVAMRQSVSTSLQGFKHFIWDMFYFLNVSAIPITDGNRNLLTVHFSVDPGPDFTW